MAAPAGPFVLHPARFWNPTGIQTIPLTLGSDVDLTLPAGQTGGICARAIKIGNTGGNLGFYDATGAGPFVQAVQVGELFKTEVSLIVNATTSCSTVSAVL